MVNLVKLSMLKVGIIFLPVILGKLFIYGLGAGLREVSIVGGNEIHDLVFAIGIWLSSDAIVIIGVLISITLWIKYIHKSGIK